MKKEYVFQKLIISLLILFSITINAQSVVINEIVTDPQSDWSSNSFNGTAGSGTVSQGVDEYIELYIKASGLDLTGWTIELNDSSPVTGDLTDSGAFSVSNYVTNGTGSFTNTQNGDFLVLGNVDGAGTMNNNITINLKDNTGSLIDTITLGGGSGQTYSGNAGTIGDEAVYRMPNGTDTDNTSDFSKGISSPGSSNPTQLSWDGSLNTDWSNSSNWATGILPTSNDNVFIPNVENKPVIGNSTHSEIQNLDVSNSNLIVNGGSLLVNGSSSGSVTYSRNLETNNWYLMSTPLDGIVFNDSFVSSNSIDSGTDNNLGIASYTTSSDNWNYLQVGSSIQDTEGKGYAIKRSAAGAINMTGAARTNDINISIVTGGSGNYNLIGNPFLSSISSSSFLQDNSEKLVSETIWVWNQSSGNYEAKVSGENFIVTPTQGFFVRAKSSNTVVVKKSHQTQGGTFQKSEKFKVILSASIADQKRSIKLFFVDGATRAFDNGWDGETFIGQDSEFNLSTQLLENNQGISYEVQGLPKEDVETTTVPLKLKASSGQEITFSADSTLPDGVQVYLEDKSEGKMIELTESANYKITISNDINDTGRFYLHTSSSSLSTNSNFNNPLSILYSDGELHLTGLENGGWSLSLYDILGKEYVSKQIKISGKKSVNLPQLRPGIYLVQLQSQSKKVIKKFMIK